MKKGKAKKRKRWGSESTREEQRRKRGTPAPRGVEDWEGMCVWRTWLDSSIALPNSSSATVSRPSKGRWAEWSKGPSILTSYSSVLSSEQRCRWTVSPRVGTQRPEQLPCCTPYLCRLQTAYRSPVPRDVRTHTAPLSLSCTASRDTQRRRGKVRCMGVHSRAVVMDTVESTEHSHPAEQSPTQGS